MKKTDIPQDKSALKSIRELCYAVDEKGKYTTGLSSGWAPKTIALDNAMAEIERRTEAALRRVRDGQSSPIEYYMELHKMDVPILAAYMGKWPWQVRRHLKPNVFRRLRQKTLEKYARLFEVTVAELVSHANRLYP